MNARVLAITVIFINILRDCQCRRYDNFSLYNVVPSESEHLKFLQHVAKRKYMDLIFWKKPQRLFENVQFIVNPMDKDDFLERIQHYKLEAEILIADVQSEFDNQASKKYYRQGTNFTWDNYHTLEDINQWLTDIALKYSDILELDSIGKSVEGRNIFSVCINKGSAKDKVIIEGGIHGNEWLAVEFVIYLINELVNGPSMNRGLDDLSKKYVWYLVPVLNPDGFVYSHTEDRMWRKNRKVFGNGVGVDLNRNFDYNFAKFDSSDNVKYDNYCGLHPESEPETIAVTNMVRANKENLQFYLSFHDFGQKIIIPFGDRIMHIENYVEMENYGKQAMMRIFKMYGTKYSIGTIYDTLGLRITGNSASWVKKTFKVRHVFTFLLRDNGTYGYALPPKFILPTCKETLEGIVELMSVKRRRNMQALFDTASGVRGNITILILIMFCTVY